MPSVLVSPPLENLMDLSSVARITFFFPLEPPKCTSYKPYQYLNHAKYLYSLPFNGHRIPRIVCCSLAAASSTSVVVDSGIQFHQKLMYLESLKVNALKAVEKNPTFRSASLASLKLVEDCLSSMGILRSDFGRIFDMYPQLLTCDPHNDLFPVFEFLLNEVEVPFAEIPRSINRCPRLLVSSVDNQLRPTLFFLRKLGFMGKRSISCQTTLLLVSSVENTLIPKLEYLQGLGFSHSEVANMVIRSPALLTYSIEKNFVPKVEYFLEEMGRDLAEIKKFPQYFSFSLGGRIRPRHSLLSQHGVSMPLSEMLKVSDGEFNLRLLERRLQHVDVNYTL